MGRESRTVVRDAGAGIVLLPYGLERKRQQSYRTPNLAARQGN